MTDDKAHALPCGLYVIEWVNDPGSVSVAAVGHDAAGRPWYAPTDWTSVPWTDWSLVASARLLTTQAEQLDAASLERQTGWKEGEAALAKINGEWVPVEVVAVYLWRGRATARVRRRGLTNAGRPYPTTRRFPEDLRRPPDPLPANVYADYLEDRGEPAAARKLREAFPLATPQEPPARA